MAWSLSISLEDQRKVSEGVMRHLVSDRRTRAHHDRSGGGEDLRAVPHREQLGVAGSSLLRQEATKVKFAYKLKKIFLVIPPKCEFYRDSAQL